MHLTVVLKTNLESLQQGALSEGLGVQCVAFPSFLESAALLCVPSLPLLSAAGCHTCKFMLMLTGMQKPQSGRL